MKLSIITPIYNGEKYLPMLLYSIKAQHFSDWELLLIDDGSTDNSPILCDRYAAEDNRIRVIHQNNGGVSSARNVGLENAKGEWIGFVDCDDCPKPEMFSKLIQATKSPNCDFVMGAYEKVSNDKSQVISIHNNGVIQNNQIKKIIYSMAFWSANYNGTILPTIYGSVWPNIYRADIIHKYSISFPNDITIGEDLLFNLSYLQYVNKVIMIDEPLYEYNIVNLSATRKQNQNLWHQYIKLNNRVSDILFRIYGQEDELVYNIHKQYMNFAINVAEEQICVYLNNIEKHGALRSLCDDNQLHNSCKYIIKNGKSIKEIIQAWIIFRKKVFLLNFWLDRK